MIVARGRGLVAVELFNVGLHAIVFPDTRRQGITINDKGNGVNLLLNECHLSCLSTALLFYKVE